MSKFSTEFIAVAARKLQFYFLLNFWKSKTLRQVSVLFSEKNYQRSFPGKIWRNPWFEFWNSILDIYSPLVLSTGQTIATAHATYRNIVVCNMLRAFGHPVVKCSDMLWHVGCCWLKFENGQIFHATFVDAAWCCSRFARFVQQRCV